MSSSLLSGGSKLANNAHNLNAFWKSHNNFAVLPYTTRPQGRELRAEKENYFLFSLNSIEMLGNGLTSLKLEVGGSDI